MELLFYLQEYNQVIIKIGELEDHQIPNGCLYGR